MTAKMRHEHSAKNKVKYTRRENVEFNKLVVVTPYVLNRQGRVYYRPITLIYEKQKATVKQ